MLLYIIIFIVLIIVVGVIVYFVMKNKKSEPEVVKVNEVKQKVKLSDEIKALTEIENKNILELEQNNKREKQVYIIRNNDNKCATTFYSPCKEDKIEKCNILGNFSDHFNKEVHMDDCIKYNYLEKLFKFPNKKLNSYAYIPSEIKNTNLKPDDDNIIRTELLTQTPNYGNKLCINEDSNGKLIFDKCNLVDENELITNFKNHTIIDFNKIKEPGKLIYNNSCVKYDEKTNKLVSNDCKDEDNLYITQFDDYNKNIIFNKEKCLINNKLVEPENINSCNKFFIKNNMLYPSLTIETL